MMSELKPCPFCGGVASIGYFGDYEITASCDNDDDANFDCPGRAGACEYFRQQSEDAAHAKH